MLDLAGLAGIKLRSVWVSELASARVNRQRGHRARKIPLDFSSRGILGADVLSAATAAVVVIAAVAAAASAVGEEKDEDEDEEDYPHTAVVSEA